MTEEPTKYECKYFDIESKSNNQPQLLVNNCFHLYANYSFLYVSTTFMFDISFIDSSC